MEGKAINAIDYYKELHKHDSQRIIKSQASPGCSADQKRPPADHLRDNYKAFINMTNPRGNSGHHRKRF